MLTAERLRELLKYNPRTGMFTWRMDRWGGRGYGVLLASAGDIAGYVRWNGRRYIRVDGPQYYASRHAWLYVTGHLPTFEIEHKDTNPSNDAWDNLREATHQQNMYNKRPYKTNKSGQKGVYLKKDKRGKPKYVAKINVNGDTVWLGRFATKGQATRAYCAASKKYHGEFGRVA